MRRSTALALLFTACLGTSTGCAPKSAPPDSADRAKTGAKPEEHSVTNYKLAGVVREADAKTGRVVIRHEKIPGFMDAMTMPFTLKDRSELDDVRPGDEVEGTLRVERRGKEVSDYELKGLVVTNFATPAPLTLKLSGGSPEVSKAPVILKPGDTVPDFTMTDQDGRTRKLSDDRGKVVALTFIFTRCPLPDFCPRMDRKFAEMADRVSSVRGRSEHVRLLSVSFDPGHDTPAVLKAHARSAGASPPLWTFAVASHAELAKVARPLGLVYGPAPGGDVIHNLVIAVIDPEGRLVRLETGEPVRSLDTADLLKAIYSRLPITKR